AEVSIFISTLRERAGQVKREGRHRVKVSACLQFRGNVLSTSFCTSPSHAVRCSAVLVTTTPNMRREHTGTPQNETIQSFHIRSSGSPKTSCSRSRGVLEVLKTTTAFARSRPTGIPSPLSVLANLYAM